MKFLHVLGVVGVLVGHSFSLDREAFTFTRYDLDVRVEPEQQRLAVRGKITLRNDSASPQKNLALQISSTLDWKSIQIGGEVVPLVSHPYTSDIDHTGLLSEAIVSLAPEIPPKGTVELEVGYEGVIPLDASRLTRIGVPEEKAKHSDWDQIGKSFTALRGVGYVTWYPVAMESADLSEGSGGFETLERWKQREAQSEMKVNLVQSGASSGAAPNVLCNGKEINQAVEEVGRAQLVRAECSFMPLGLTVPVLVIAQYSIQDRPSTTVYYFPAHKSGADNFALAAELAAPFVTQWFGPPQTKVEVAELVDPEAAPFESGNMLLTPLSSNDSRLYEGTAVHQLAHTAFSSPRPWMDEGLAHFAQAVYRERESGRQAALDFMALHRAAVASTEKGLAAEHNQNAAADESLINTGNEEFYRSKAMYVWWMLRDMVGEEALKRALAAYHPDHDKEASYAQHLIEAQAKRDLEWFFADWVYRDRGLPDFRVESVYPRRTLQGAYLVTISIENLGDSGAEVPLKVLIRGSEVTKRLEVRGKSKNTLRIEVPSVPQEVVVNDGSVPESDMSNNTFRVEAPVQNDSRGGAANN